MDNEEFKKLTQRAIDKTASNTLDEIDEVLELFRRKSTGLYKGYTHKQAKERISALIGRSYILKSDVEKALKHEIDFKMMPDIHRPREPMQVTVYEATIRNELRDDISKAFNLDTDQLN